MSTQDQQGIAREFGNGNLGKHSLWVIKLKNGKEIRDWATSAEEARRGVPESAIVEMFRENVFFGDAEYTEFLASTFLPMPE